jgi:hypothetical protein
VNEWAAFWLLCAVLVVCEVVVTLHGIDTHLWQFRTPAELQLQQKLIEKASK